MANLPAASRSGTVPSMPNRFLIPLTLLVAALSGCGQQSVRNAGALPPPQQRSEWATAWSDVPADPQFQFGKLSNGMRFALRRNDLPKGTALVRMEISAGSLDESENERGFAHFVEHMAFNGSTHVAEGEMVKQLERSGLAFGADTNASTSHTETLYKLDLPRNDPALLDTALILMRETASELSFSPEAVAREKGVVLSEMRDRNGWRQRDYVDSVKFEYPSARFPDRLPIGTAESVEAASASALKAFWRREYVPAHATIIVIGDFEPQAVEAAIRKHFEDWQAASPSPEPQPTAGPIEARDKGRSTTYVDPALSERIVVSRNARWNDEPDTLANRREDLLQAIGYGVINRRLLRLTRQQKPPFRAAGFGTSNVFRAAKASNITIETVDGKWQAGLLAAVAEYRRALAYGFTQPEVAEQIANARNGARNAAAAQDTRSNGELVNAAITLLRDERLPSRPSEGLARLEAFIHAITPKAVLDAVRRDVVKLDKPLIRFSGRRAPAGGVVAIRDAWKQAMRAPLIRGSEAAPAEFGYTHFGTDGAVSSDSREVSLGVRTLRFANGVRLNLRHTDIEKDRVLVQLSIDGGDMLNTKDNPLATAMVGNLAAGGLGKHSQDEIQSLLAGRTVSAGVTSTAEAFVTLAGTTPADLELQMQLLAAYVTDPGYRPEGQTLYYNAINTYFARLKSTPGDALGAGQGGILSDGDPRFSLQPVEAFRAQTFTKLKAALADRLTSGAIEIGVIGDIDEAAVIAAVARTFGALPPREAEFRTYAENRTRPFSADHSRRTLTHTGPADQAIVRLIWPTRDGEDPIAALQFALLEKLAQNALTETVREALGKAYSPSASSETSRVWRGYGSFSLTASVNVSEVAAVRAAMLQAAAKLRDDPASDDELRRARAPMIEAIANRLKGNRGWIDMAGRAQTQPDRIERQVHAIERLSSITAGELQALAGKYLLSEKVLEIDVLPATNAAVPN